MLHETRHAAPGQARMHGLPNRCPVRVEENA